MTKSQKFLFTNYYTHVTSIWNMYVLFKMTKFPK